MTWPYKYFTKEEILSPDGLRQLDDKSAFKLQGFSVKILELWRIAIGSPVFCNHSTLRHRGYRSARENELNTGKKGVKDSYHTQGVAYDTESKTFKTADYTFLMFVWSFGRIKEGLEAFTGIGCYPHKKFTHSDCRTLFDAYIVCWNGKTNETKVCTLKEVEESGDFEGLFLLFKNKFSLPIDWELSAEAKKHDIIIASKIF